MRRGILIAGIVIVAAGFVLGYFPGPSEAFPGGAQQIGPGSPLKVGGLPLAFLTPSIAYTASWTATPTGSPEGFSLSIYSCGTGGNCQDLNTSTATPVAGATSDRGSVGWDGSAGEYFAVFSTGATNLTLTYQAPLLGGLAAIFTLGVGAALVIVAFLRSSPKRTSAVPPEPTAEPPKDAEPSEGRP